MACDVNRLGDFRREMPEWECQKSALENALARLFKIADAYGEFVNPPKEKDKPANAVALDALADLFACTYAYVKEYQSEMKRYFARGENKGGVRYGFVF